MGESRQSFARMDARRSIGGLALLISALGLGVLLVISSSVRQANNASDAAERQQVENALKLKVAEAVNDATFAAIWDDTIIHSVQTPDKAWAETNVTQYMTGAFQQSLSFVLVDFDQVLAASNSDGPMDVKAFDSYRPAILPLLSKLKDDVKRGTLSRSIDAIKFIPTYHEILPWQRPIWRADYMLVDSKPAIVTAMRAVPWNDEALSKLAPAIVVNIDFVDDQFIGALARSLGLEALSWKTESVASEQIGISLSQTDEELKSSGELGQLVWTPRRLGTPIAWKVIPVSALAILFLFGIAALLLRRLATATQTLIVREATAHRESREDALTTLSNRTGFKEHLNKALANCGPGRAVAVAYFDFDNFKDINDTRGHDFGNELLKSVAIRMKACLREDDKLARLGGDEFAVLRSHVDAEADAETFGRQIQCVLDQPFTVLDNEIQVSISTGIKVESSANGDCEEVLRKADIALYRAKEEGRNRYCIFNSAMELEVRRRHEIEREMKRAINTDQISVVYQPIMDRDGRTISGVEALMRWRNPILGVVSPADFVPVAEKTGAIIDLGKQLMRKAFVDVQNWPGVDLSLNVSVIQLRDPRFVEDMRRIVDETGVRAEIVELEVTESVMMEHSSRIKRVLEELKGIGFRIALDDFGTGYSGFGYLQSFAFDRLKIDRSFVCNIGHTHETNTIIFSVVSLCRSLGMEVVAEGVETSDQFEFLKATGCHAFQGYLFSKPATADAIGSMCMSANLAVSA